MRIPILILYLQLLLWGLFLSRQVYSQNLIFNGNFEDVNYCKEFKQPCSPSAWFYMNDNPLGYHKRNELNSKRNYALLFGEFGDSLHQYWETIFADNLVPGKEYKLSFDLTTVNIDLDCYGFVFTDTLFFSACDTLLSPANYIRMSEGTVKLLKSGWTHVEMRFTSVKESKYLIVGKFGNACTKIISPRFAFDNLAIQPVKKYAIAGKVQKDSIYAITQRHNYKRACDQKAQPKPLVLVEKKKVIDSLVLDDIQFEFNEYKILNPEIFEEFKSKFDPQTIKRIEIYGYTDSVGSDRYNLNLSRLRAEAVKELLMKRYSIPASMIAATGKGISRDYADMGRNRRVEILVFSKTE